MPCGDCKLEISELTVAISRKPVLHAVEESAVQERWKKHGRPVGVSLLIIFLLSWALCLEETGKVRVNR